MQFTFNTSPKIIFKAGALAEIAALVHGERVFVVTDKGMAGLLPALTAQLSDFKVFDGVIADPPEDIILKAVLEARAYQATMVIGFGGGSPMDTAKIVALLSRSDESLADIYGIGNVKGKRLPLILIPTTAGTGSEVTPIAIITTGKTTKMGVVSPVLLPDIALLDPDLTRGLPAQIAAATGIDAMVHAIEAYASKSANNNPLSRTLAREALRLMGASLVKAVEGDALARENMLLGSMLAGQAFANSPVAAVHALAYPLGGHYKLPHGLTNALVLPHVMRFNEGYADYSPLCHDLFGNNHDFAGQLALLSIKVGLKPRLRDYDIPFKDLAMLATDAMKQTRLLINNPREVTYDDALTIYGAAW
jgi:alcohol dehydrogenase class IV